MSNPTFNKYKSTTIYGNLSVRDLTNQSGDTVLEQASTDLSGSFISREDSTFTKKVVCNALLADINANNILTTKEYVDSVVSNGGQVSLSGTNNFTGFNTYNSNFPTSTLPTSTSVTSDSIVNKGMLDTIYQTISGMSSYLTTMTASNTYQTIAGMSSYLTTATASSTYQTIANMTNYLTTSQIASTYQTIANMSNYLTTSQIASTYQTIANSISLSGNNTFTGLNSFTNENGNGTTIQKLTIGQIIQPTNTSNYLNQLQVGGGNVGSTIGIVTTSISQVTTPNGTWLSNSFNNLSSGNISTGNLFKSTPTSEQSVGWIVSTYTFLANTTSYLNSQDIISFTLPSSPNGSFSIWCINFNTDFDYYISSNTTGFFTLTLLGNNGGADQVATIKNSRYFLGSVGAGGWASSPRQNVDFTAIIKCYDNKNPFKISISSTTTTTRFYPSPANVQYFNAIRLA